MIEIKYNKSNAGIDNFFDFYNEQEYIPMSISELRVNGSILKFYISLFKKFNIIAENEHGVSFWWNTRFPCKYNDIEFELVYDNEWDDLHLPFPKSYLPSIKRLRPISSPHP